MQSLFDILRKNGYYFSAIIVREKKLYLCSVKILIKKGRDMSTTALEGLLSYLYDTLSPSSMQWVGEHLIEHAKQEQGEQLRPYTVEEIDAMLDEAEAAFEAGDYLTNDDVFHHRKAAV